LTGDELAAILIHPQVDVFLLRIDGHDQGTLELRRAFPDIEIAPDPRVAGLLPKNAAPTVPLLSPVVI